MYKYTDNIQSNFLDFNQPIGLHMNPENRHVKMADAILWEIFEKKYSRLFKGKKRWNQLFRQVDSSAKLIHIS